MEITVLDANLNRLSVIDVFDSLIWTDRYWAHGDFEIFTAASVETFLTFQQDRYISIPESDRLMVIETIELKTDVENGDKFVVRGRSLESILDRRIVWDQTVLSGNLQSAVQTLLNQNAISPTDGDRKILRLLYEPTEDINVLSVPVDIQFSGDNLYTVIQRLCETSGIGFKLVPSSDGMFVFSLYSGVDRSFNQITNPFVAFSPELENLSNTNYYHTKTPLKTITLVGGEGEGSDRAVTQASIPGYLNRDLERRELFTDASDISSLVDGADISEGEYYTLLLHRGLTNLLENQPVSTFDGKIDPTVNYIYGEDFFLGDIVQIANEYGLTGRTRMTELVFSEDLSGRDIYPTFEMIE